MRPDNIDLFLFDQYLKERAHRGLTKEEFTTDIKLFYKLLPTGDVARVCCVCFSNVLRWMKGEGLPPHAFARYGLVKNLFSHYKKVIRQRVELS